MKTTALLSSCRGGGGGGGGGTALLLLILLYSCCFVDQIATALATDTSSSSTRSSTTTSTTSSTATNPSSSLSSSSIIYKSRDYHLLEIVPHSRTSFTQGLTLSLSSSNNNILYEGTGLNHQSQILQHDPTQNMRTLERKKVEPGHLFGEGITTYYVDRRLDNSDSDGGNINGKHHNHVVREHRLIQLTWKDGIGMIYRINDTPSSRSDDNTDNNNEQQSDSSLELIDKFTFNTHTSEGWGITFVPHTNEFYVSDGSEYIFVWDVETLQEKRRMAVTLERRGEEESVRVKYVNELEFVDFNSKNKKCGDDVKDWDIHDVYLEQCQEGDGQDPTTTTTSCSSSSLNSKNAAAAATEECSNNDENGTGFTSTMSILANVWYQDVLIRIDPVTAKITRVYDLSDIYPYDQRKKDGADCLNGISVTGKESSEEEGLELWVTGKLWPKMYRIRLID